MTIAVDWDVKYQFKQTILPFGPFSLSKQCRLMHSRSPLSFHALHMASDNRDTTCSPLFMSETQNVVM